MKIIRQSSEILAAPDGIEMLKNIERAGRTCYKSENLINNASCMNFTKKMIESGHEAMIEHGGTITVKFLCNRAISHEIVRHRLFSFAQESTRYVNYAKEKSNGEITVIEPHGLKKGETGYDAWFESCEKAEEAYLKLIEAGIKAEIARDVLPNSTKTELIVSGNPRQWRHFLKLRTDKAAHPQIRFLTLELLIKFGSQFPILFDDIY